MKSTAKLIDGYKSVIDNGRNHAIVTDLPKDSNGTDLGASALEATLMSLSGCISTIYKVVADKMRLNIDGLEVEMDGEKGKETIEKVTFEVKVRSDAPEDKLNKCLESTMKSCPVGMLFEKAGCEITSKLTKLN